MSQVQLPGYTGAFEANSLYIVFLGAGKEQTCGLYWSRDGKTGELAWYEFDKKTGADRNGTAHGFSPRVTPEQLVSKKLEVAVQFHKDTPNTAWYEALQQLFGTTKVYRNRRQWLQLVMRQVFNSIYGRVAPKDRPDYTKEDQNAAVVDALEHFGANSAYKYNIANLTTMTNKVAGNH